MLSCFSAHVPECSFLSCCKTLGASSSVGYRFGTMPYRTVQRVRCPLFYIPSPSDVGIVFLLGLTTSNCLLILSPRVEELLPCRRAFRSRDCLVIIYGSITAYCFVFALRQNIFVATALFLRRARL